MENDKIKAKTEQQVTNRQKANELTAEKNEVQKQIQTIVSTEKVKMNREIKKLNLRGKKKGEYSLQVKKATKQLTGQYDKQVEAIDRQLKTLTEENVSLDNQKRELLIEGLVDIAKEILGYKENPEKLLQELSDAKLSDEQKAALKEIDRLLMKLPNEAFGQLINVTEEFYAGLNDEQAITLTKTIVAYDSLNEILTNSITTSHRLWKLLTEEKRKATA